MYINQNLKSLHISPKRPLQFKKTVVNNSRFESNIWISPKDLYSILTTMLNDIVVRAEPAVHAIHSEINCFIHQPTQKNFRLLQASFANQKEKNIQEIVIRLFGIYPLVLNIAIKTALIHGESKTQKSIKKAKISKLSANPIKMHLGLYGKETEPGSEELVCALSDLANGLENCSGLEEIRRLVHNVWLASASTSSFDETSMQLFYAHQIYWNFNNTIREIKKQMPAENSDQIDLRQWLDCYTWLTTDRDGRPHDTNVKTAKLIEILEAAIRDNYIKELKQIYLLTPDMSIGNIINRIPKNADDSYSSPKFLIDDLELIKNKNPLLSELIIKIKTFGFHYLKLEFRDNSHMLSEVIDTLLEPALVEKFINCNKRFESLNREEKITFLTKLLQSENEYFIKDIKENYFRKNFISYQEKTTFYKGKDYIELMDIDPQYIKQVNVESTLGRFALMTAYSDRLHVHAIAETSGPEDALALLFLSKVSTGRTDYMDIALQPEDSGGAVTIIDMIKTLYENSIYSAHLKKRENKQYIIFGPSDTGKQGGKAMHLANMQIAQIHRMIAAQYDINPIIHVIVGYEHARCNGHLEEILDGYGTLNQTESEYMMAGLNEMRSQLLTSKQTTSFLSNLHFAHANYEPMQNLTIEQREEKAQFWLNIVDRYQRFFHDHPCLPGLLRKMARFDIINATAKGTRPPSRILNTKNLEDYPAAIRAIPWSRSFLLAGIHSEIIGSGCLAKLSAKKLHDMYLTEIDFQRYVHHIAYGAARTDMDFAWETAGEKRPSQMEIQKLAIIFEAGKEKNSYRHMLAWIDYEITCASQFVYKALYSASPVGEVNRMQLLQHINPALFEEACWRDNIFAFHKALLVEIHRHPEMLKERYIKDLFTGALTICNTSLSMMHPYAANTLNWNK